MSLQSLTAFLDKVYSTIPTRQRQWHVDNQVFQVVLCKTCQSNLVGWSVKNKRYSTYCSSKCAHTDTVIREKISNTCLDRYGVKTNLQSSASKEKIKGTCLARYGVDNFSKTKEFRDKFTSSCIARYGVDNPSKLQEIKDRIDASHIASYGKKRQSQSHISDTVIALKNDRLEMLRLYRDLKMPVSEIAETLGVSVSQLCVHFKSNLGIDISRHRVSTVERQVYEFVKSLDNRAIQSDRTVLSPKELDIYCPDYKVAIEVNGLAWHTELRGKSQFYHSDKTDQCREHGIQLIHIYDIEWKNKQEIVKSRLAAAFGQTKRIYARKCKITQLPGDQAAEFFAKNSITPINLPTVSYGLEYCNETVCVMCFSPVSRETTDNWCLLGFSSKTGITVCGSASKLLAHFIKSNCPKLITATSDLRWYTGNLYTTLGFKSVKKTPPDYWYTVKYRTIKHRAAVSETDTNWDHLVACGYDRIWDCGQLKFELQIG